MNNTSATPRAAYSVKEAAQALGMSHQTIYNLIHADDFPAVKIGGRRWCRLRHSTTGLNPKCGAGSIPEGVHNG